VLFGLRDEEQQARWREAEANLVLAAEQYDRAKALRAQRSVSQDELDRAVAARDAAMARRDLARVALDRTVIRAPFDGVLGARLVSPGDRVDTDTGLVTIDAIARLRLLFTLPEIAVPLARVGVPLELTVAARPGETFRGEVYFVAPSLDAANRRLLLKALVPNPERKLRPGMFATIQVEVARHANALVVPEAAIAYDARGPYVWLLNGDQTASRAPVAIGLRSEGHVEITEGLIVGSRIVSGGTHKVAAGAPLQQAAALPEPTP
jgi:membrane fusion protein (multidrug efflux system)